MYQRMLIDPSRKEDYIIDCSFEEYMTCSAILARYTSVRVWNGLLSSLSILSLIWSNWNVLIALMHFKDVPHIPSPIHLRMRRGIHRNSAACFTCQTMLHSVILSCVCVLLSDTHTSLLPFLSFPPLCIVTALDFPFIHYRALCQLFWSCQWRAVFSE